ncbi:MAG: pseudouridine synthase [Anaerovoracaceae bacterium]
MRLNKYIAQAGLASRRKADELTINGNVKINGLVMKEPGYDVKPDDRVEVNGKRIEAAEKYVYLMVNKPKGYVTTTEDERSRATVMELVADVPQRVFPVGRLDYNTTGLLLMTNDGDLSNRLTHPKHQVGKTYRAKVAGVLSRGKVAKLSKGVDIGGFVTSPAKVVVVKQSERSAIVDITIHEGKNRQVRKMFSAVGCPVQELQRISKAEVEYLKNL